MVKNWQTVLSRVRAALMRRGRSAHDADDFVQEAWLRLARYQRRRAVAKPEAFLMRTALNLSIDAYRASKLRGEHVLIEELQSEDQVFVATASTAESTLLARERVVRMTACLADLDDRTRTIFLAHRVDGMPYLEIAREQGVSVSAVEKHIAKVALMLTQLMDGW